MTEPITFFVAGEPKAQPRPRAFARRFGDKWQARVYDAGTAENWKSLVAAAAKPFVPAQPMTGPIRLELDFYFPRPKNHFSSKGVLKPNAPRFHVIKPDRDNCEKAVTDALKQIGMFKDDSQVCAGPINKLYAWGVRGGCMITIEELKP